MASEARKRVGKGGAKKSTKQAGKSGQGQLLAILEKRIRTSQLPGEEKLEGANLREAASFLLEAAQKREEGRPVVVLRSATGTRRFMRIALINDDMPFLVDSAAATIAAQGLAIDMLVHPVVPVRRSENGRLSAIPVGASAGETRESMIYVETARVDARQRRTLEAALSSMLADVRAAVKDWPKMRELIAEDATHVAGSEGAALLRWLGEDMMTQLGHVTKRRDGSQTQMLGVCRKSARQLLSDASYERAFQWFDRAGEDGRGGAPLVIKANILSQVHRRVPLDLFIVPLHEQGRVEALSIHAGVWTSAAMTAPPASVPRLRGQMADLMGKFGFDPDSHAGKGLAYALTALPHDLIIGFSASDIERVATAMMSLADRPRPRLVLIEAPLQRHLFGFVWLPRDMLSTTARLQIQNLLERAADATVLDWGLEVEGGNLAMLRFVLDIRDGQASPDEGALDTQLQAMLRGWTEAVEAELAKTEDPARAAAIAARYAESFPPNYRASYGPAEAAVDISRLRRLAANEPHRPLARDVRLFRLPSDMDSQLRLKIYQEKGSLPLSDAVPALENFGFRVLAEVPTGLVEKDGGTIHDFLLALPEGEDAARVLKRTEAIEEAISAVLNGLAEDDVFNRLVIGAALGAQAADWLRAFYRYLRQTGMGFTIYTVVDALSRAPQVAHGLIGLFTARHDPAFKGDRVKAEESAERAIREGLAKVTAINDDRLLRLYHEAMGAVLRTNAFAPAKDLALAFKIESAAVPALPKPVPWREIFIYSRRVEGIHLRAGPVARGGIRWSDRRDDFRTEILGLMKAQRVKNAVIVPTGAKGGFYPKQLPDPARDRDGWAAEGQESYRIFIRSLLSVTDNLVDDKVVHPEGVVIRDGDDPYFVVAADKGTARFSDTANAIAEEENFWLDDAFASGGSNGYDHKAMGITARGAWISVQRHFLEMGVGVQRESVKVVGCGDMSGDVFGNGMLLSKAIKLVAAFDHRHIFIDPDPDPAASWKERKRMFALPRSSWADYNEKLISKGGGVFPRSMKRIPLSAQMRKALGTEAKEIEPDHLISAIISAPVELIWFGGIGTYIKASSENNVQVGDPSNDALRVDARDVKAKVIGEGANLSITQAGRIEFSLLGANGTGGRINTDFIDNSAGVDCSDNEVNIKIALAPARRSRRLADTRRNGLLESMTEAVARIVLEDNRLQTLALSQAEMGGARAAASQMRLIEMLEERGELDRRTDGVADNETLARRASDGQGLTRPELAVLLSNAKLALQDAIEAANYTSDEALVPMLVEAFPETMQAEWRDDILAHRLRHELVATKLANRVINRLGLVHPFELAEEEGVGLAEVASAFVCAEELLGVGAIWAAIDASRMGEEARLSLLDHVALAMRSHMADLLRVGAGAKPPSQVIGELTKGIAELGDAAEGLLEAHTREHSARLRALFIDAGAPEKLAAKVAHLFDMDGGIGLAKASVDTGIPATSLAEAFTDLGARLGLDWAQSTAAVMAPSDPWERLLVAGLARDFQQMRLDFLRSLAKKKAAKADPPGAIATWAQASTGAIRQFRAMIARAQAAAPVTPAMLAQIASQARNLLQR